MSVPETQKDLRGTIIAALAAISFAMIGAFYSSISHQLERIADKQDLSKDILVRTQIMSLDNRQDIKTIWERINDYEAK